LVVVMSSRSCCNNLVIPFFGSRLIKTKKIIAKYFQCLPHLTAYLDKK
jgi:hypothetical protein